MKMRVRELFSLKKYDVQSSESEKNIKVLAEQRHSLKESVFHTNKQNTVNVHLKAGL